MTTSEIIQYYSNLLILQYRNKPKAKGHIEALITPIVMDQLPTQVQNAYNLDTAVGVQLDVIGKYAGVTRQGYDFNGPVTLNDSDFRLFIKIAIVENYGGSSLSDIQNLIAMFFSGGLFVFDHKNMHMDYFVNTSTISLQLLEFFIKAGKLPKPMGVGIGAIIAAPVINKFFSFSTYDYVAPYGSPFNTYDSYDNNSPWVTYDDSITI